MNKLPEIGSIMQCGYRHVSYIVIDHVFIDEELQVKVQWLVPDDWKGHNNTAVIFGAFAINTDTFQGMATELIKALL